MIEVWFLFGAAVIAGVPSFIWLVLLAEALLSPCLGWIGAGLIFWLVMYYMISGRKLLKEQHERS